MKNVLPALAATLLLYIGALVAFYISDFMNQGGGDSGVRQSLVVVGVASVVLLGAFIYSFYKALSYDPRWWYVVGLHVVLAALVGKFLMGY